MGSQRYQVLILKSLNAALYDKRIFADVIKDLNIRSVVG